MTPSIGPRGPGDAAASTPAMSPLEVKRVKLEMLRREHRALDEQIAAMQGGTPRDPLELQRLKRAKLRLKDRIAVLEDAVTPDIIA